ncbi:MAG: hypothetical protein GXY03_05970 [Solirubrobacterales bacterium]|nr:hypothetical protein [Solirubrobacterales bacterium]
MRGRLSQIASWQFALVAAATTVVAMGIVALALGLGADEEGLPDGSVTVVAPTGETGARAGRGPGGRAATPGGAEVAAIADGMSVDEQVAQVLLLGFRGTDLTAPVFAQLGERPLGGIVVDSANYESADQLAALAGEPAVIAEREGTVAPWVLAPQEGGANNAFADLPPASAAADLPSASAAFAEAEAAAAALGGAGLTGALAPTLDVGAPDAPAVGDRSFSDDPRDVADYARAFVDAFRAARLLSVGGHFPGLGSGTADTRYGLSQVATPLEDLRTRDMVPFRAAIRAGIPAIMMSNGLYETDDFVTPGSLSPTLVGLLRRELGFRGLIVTDDLADPGVTALTDIPVAAVEAVRAGADLVYLSGPPAEQDAAFDALVGAVRRGTVTRARLREAVLRNLSVKRNYGLID